MYKNGTRPTFIFINLTESVRSVFLFCIFFVGTQFHASGPRCLLIFESIQIIKIAELLVIAVTFSPTQTVFKSFQLSVQQLK